MATYQKRRTDQGVIYITATVRIHPYPSSSRSFPTRKEAKAWADDLEQTLREQKNRGGLRLDVPKLTVAQLAKEYLDDPETQRLRYHCELMQTMAWWVSHYGTTRVMELNVLKLREARELLRPGRAPATVNRYLSAMRSCWNFGRSGGLVPQELGWPSRLMLTEPRGRQRYLSPTELPALLRAAQAHTPVMHAAVLLSVGTGLRLGELVRMRWSDIDLERQRLTIMVSKNDSARTVYLPGSVIEALRRLKRAPVVGTHVISDEAGQPVNNDFIERRWSKLRSEVGLINFRWHDLRHTCASLLAQRGANLFEIGSVLGHKSPTMTARYSHLVQGQPVTGATELDKSLRSTT